MPESGNRLVVSVITDKEDVSSSSAPNTKARREKAPAVAIKTPELESPPVELPQAPETQESVSSTEVHIEEIVKQVNECRIKNAHKLGIPTESVKTEQIPSNSGAWMVRFINETGSVPTLEDDLEKLRELVDWVWSPKNGYRAEIVLLRHHKRDNFIAIVRDDRDNSNLLRVERSYRETPEKALARLPSEIGSKYPGTVRTAEIIPKGEKESEKEAVDKASNSYACIMSSWTSTL
ncbi:hypothetical protein J4E93_006755 [Alternaria ventricosa]|uniref:uncharacterized protein n=1 Tax=Alternaria ventricosa TaxID=1187951 RepID=UPI0020C45A91|nr:uncharacterized protein J4E93_006755 [Alternaria ventricosa]KAI4643743.1 hypothetical protein J4E93_006755 [Alternaria ventricosa]